MSTSFKTSYHSASLRIIDRDMSLARMLDLYSLNSEFRQLPIVVTGISGMAIGFPLAFKLQLEICVVRKNGDSTNALRALEGYIPQGDFVILDDFIGCGTTVRTIISAIKKESPLANCVGVILYRLDAMDGWEKIDGIPIYYR